MKRIAIGSSAALAIVCLALGAHWYLMHRRKISAPVSMQPVQDTTDVCTVTTIKCPPGPNGEEVSETKGNMPAASDHRFSLDQSAEGLLPVKQGQLWGYKDNSGKMVISPQFEKAYAFSNGLARVRSQKKYGYIDKAGNIVIPIRYVAAYDFSEERAAVFVCREDICRSQNPDIIAHELGRWGYIDTTGKLVIPGRYRKAESFSEGLAAVTSDGFEGFYIDRNGEVVIVTSGYHGRFFHGVAKIGDRKHQVYIDKMGRPVTPKISTHIPMQPDQSAGDACALVRITCPPESYTLDFLEVKGIKMFSPDDHFKSDPFSEGLLRVYHDFRWGYRDSSGKMVIPAQFEDAAPFREHRAAVVEFISNHGFLAGYIDPSGKMVIPPRFRKARSFSEGLAPVEVGRGERSRWGFIDLTGKMVIPARFSNADEFSEGLAGVSRGHKYGYISHAGKFVVPPQFQSADPFSNGRGRVGAHSKFGYVDKTGKMVIPSRYVDANDFSEGRAAVFICHDCRNQEVDLGVSDALGRWGYIDTTGKLVIPARYTEAKNFSEGLAAVTAEPYQGYYIDRNGQVVIITSGYHSNFYHGVAKIGEWKYHVYIDKMGRPVSPIF
jgi:hypothetical protein